MPLLIAGKAYSADFSWNNSGTNLLWDNPANWLVGGSPPANAPGSGDNIGTPTLFGTIALNIASATVADWTYNSASTQTVTKTVQSGTLTIAGTLSKSGSGSLVLRSSGANQLNLSVGQISLSGGNLNIGHDSGTSLLTTLTAGSATISGGNLNFLVGGPSYAITGTLTMSGVGTLNLAGHGVGSLVANTRVDVGALSSASATAVIQSNANTAGNANDTGTLVLNNTSGTATYAGIIRPGTSVGNTNIVNIEKNGDGTQVFSGLSNTYNGTTVINAGTLLVNGTHTGGGNYTVSGGTLGGSGSITTSIGSSVTVEGAAVLQGGAGAAASGALTLSGDLTMQNDSIITLALGAGGTHSSLLRSGGTWVFDSEQVFLFTDLGANAGFYDNIISGLASDPGTLGSWTIQNSGWEGTFTYDGAGGVDLTLSAVPEPSVFLLAAVGLAVMVTGRRRK